MVVKHFLFAFPPTEVGDYEAPSIFVAVLWLFSSQVYALLTAMTWSKSRMCQLSIILLCIVERIGNANPLNMRLAWLFSSIRDLGAD